MLRSTDFLIVAAAAIRCASRVTPPATWSRSTTNTRCRSTSPVFLNCDKNLVATDFGKLNYLCVNCHQIRGVTSERYTDSLGGVKTFNQLPFFPLPKSKDDNAPVNYQVGQSFSVHDGNQSNLFKGINGYEYNGVTYTRTWNHSDNSCTTCHMNKYDAIAKVGGHTLNVNEAVCENLPYLRSHPAHTGQDRGQAHRTRRVAGGQEGLQEVHQLLGRSLLVRGPDARLLRSPVRDDGNIDRVRNAPRQCQHGLPDDRIGRLWEHGHAGHRRELGGEGGSHILELRHP